MRTPGIQKGIGNRDENVESDAIKDLVRVQSGAET